MMNGGKRKIELIEYVGLFLVAFSFLMLDGIMPGTWSKDNGYDSC